MFGGGPISQRNSWTPQSVSRCESTVFESKETSQVSRLSNLNLNSSLSCLLFYERLPDLIKGVPKTK